jgi:hypothetical protein
MSKTNIPGNYPALAFAHHHVQNELFIEYNASELISTGKTLVLLDIHKFSSYCAIHRGDRKQIEQLLKQYFCVFAAEICQRDGMILKFIGDAIFCVFQKDTDDLIETCCELLSNYRATFCPKYPPTDLAIVIMQSVELLEGFVGCDEYLEWSIFGVGINNMFNVIKKHPTEGRVTVISSAGEVLVQRSPEDLLST